MCNPQAGPARRSTLEVITAPLGFFVLALLIVESFLAVVLVGGQLDAADKIIGMWIGSGLFLLVVGLVFLLVWFKPENLTFDQESHLRVRGIIPPAPPKEQKGPPRKKCQPNPAPSTDATTNPSGVKP